MPCLKHYLRQIFYDLSSRAERGICSSQFSSQGEPLKRTPDKTSQINRLSTEQPNPASRDLDLNTSLEIARIINAEDAKVAAAVKRALPQIARAIDFIAAAVEQGGRLIYVGAGTSGRIAALDAAECP